MCPGGVKPRTPCADGSQPKYNHHQNQLSCHGQHDCSLSISSSWQWSSYSSQGAPQAGLTPASQSGRGAHKLDWLLGLPKIIMNLWSHEIYETSNVNNRINNNKSTKISQHAGAQTGPSLWGSAPLGNPTAHGRPRTGTTHGANRCLSHLGISHFNRTKYNKSHTFGPKRYPRLPYAVCSLLLKQILANYI